MKRWRLESVLRFVGPVMAVFLVTNCAAWAPPKYKGPGGEITKDMLPVVEGDQAGITLVHLPSGKAVFRPLSPIVRDKSKA